MMCLSVYIKPSNTQTHHDKFALADKRLVVFMYTKF